MPPSKYAKDIEKIKTALAGIVPQVKCIPAIKEAMSDMRVEMAAVVTKIDLLHDSCPYTGDIALARVNHKKLGDVEADIKELREKRSEDRIDSVKVLAKVALIAAFGGGTAVGLDKLLEFFH